MKRIPIRRKAKRYPVPKAETGKVDTRAGGACEGCGSTQALQRAHIKHRGMGGAQRRNAAMINDHRNIALCCMYCHDVIDRRVMVAEHIRSTLSAKLKLKTGWHEWAAEHGINDI